MKDYLATHTCHCPCDTCEPVCDPIGGAAGGQILSGDIAAANMNSDMQGTAFFSPNILHSTGDWMGDNSTKWDAFKNAVLKGGYADPTSFMNTEPSSMSFNDFVYLKTIKYLDDNYYKNENGDNRLIRDDSKIANASFYKGYDKSSDAPEKAAAGDGSYYLDNGGVYIGGTNSPAPLQGGNEDIPFQEREKMRICSIIDESHVKKMDDALYANAADEAGKIESEAKKNSGGYYEAAGYICGKAQDKTISVMMDNVTETITGGNEALKKDLGTAIAVIETGTNIKDMADMADKGEGEKLATTNLKNGEKLLSGQLTGLSKKISDTGTRLYQSFAENTVKKTLNDINNGSNAIIKIFTGKPLSANEQDIIDRSLGKREQK
jgi:hypothetical protein